MIGMQTHVDSLYSTSLRAPSPSGPFKPSGPSTSIFTFGIFPLQVMDHLCAPSPWGPPSPSGST